MSRLHDFKNLRTIPETSPDSRAQIGTTYKLDEPALSNGQCDVSLTDEGSTDGDVSVEAHLQMKCAYST